MAVDLLWVEENLCGLLQKGKITIDEYNNFYDSLMEDEEGIDYPGNWPPSYYENSGFEEDADE